MKLPAEASGIRRSVENATLEQLAGTALECREGPM